MKKVSVIFTLAIVLLLGSIFIPLLLTDDDYARITDLEYKAVVVDEPGSQGKVVITERLTFDVHAASNDNLFWELWRVLPEEYVDGVKVDYKVNYVKEIRDDGSSITYPESPKLYWDDFDYIDTEGGYGPGKWFHSPGPYDDFLYYESLIFYVDGLYRDTVVYEIQYEMHNASLRYNDASELYVSLFAGEDTLHLNSVKGEVLIPLDKMPKQGNYEAYTYGTNADSFPYQESTSAHPGYHSFTFNLNKEDLKFKKYNQFIEFALIAHGEDKHKFTQFASINDYYDADVLEDINKAQIDYKNLSSTYYQGKKNILMLSIGSSLAVFGVSFGLYRSKKKRYPFYKPSQDIEFFRDIPSELDANFARRLVFSKSNNQKDTGDGYSAALLSLAYKDYLELVRINPAKDWNGKNTKIVLKEALVANRKPLTEIERNYLQLINRHAVANEISLDSLQNKVSNDYQYTDSFLKNVTTSLNRYGLENGYYQIADYKKPRNSIRALAGVLAFMGLAIMLIGNISIYGSRLDLAFGSFFIIGGAFILCALLLTIASRKFVLLTQFGEDEYEKWYGLYHFLNSETLMKEREVLDLVIWEQYLIYATAFGISEKVVKALKIRVPEETLQNSAILYNPMFRSRAFYYTNSRSFHSATRTASYTSRAGSHSGVGGGGRGGGGGGGGH